MVSLLSPRRAAIGGTRPAARDGAVAESTVTTTPTPNASSIDLGDTTAFPSGSAIPRALINALNSRATPTPSPIPTVAAITPVTAASTMTVVVTWRRLAPSARRSAISRARWATVIENVLLMMKALTNMAISEKMSRNVLNGPVDSLTLSLFSSASCCPVITSREASVLPSRAVVNTPASCSCGTSSAEIATIEFTWPGSVSRASAVSRSNSTAPAPPWESASP